MTTKGALPANRRGLFASRTRPASVLGGVSVPTPSRPSEPAEPEQVVEPAEPEQVEPAPAPVIDIASRQTVRAPARCVPIPGGTVSKHEIEGGVHVPTLRRWVKPHVEFHTGQIDAHRLHVARTGTTSVIVAADADDQPVAMWSVTSAKKSASIRLVHYVYSALGVHCERTDFPRFLEGFTLDVHEDH